MGVVRVRLAGGPLDGGTIAVDGDDEAGAYMVVPGWSRRAIYEPDPDGDPRVWLFRGEIE